jgi:hypothetical protein
LKTTLLFILLLIANCLFGQKYDYKWIMGFPPGDNTDIIFTDTSADTLSIFRNVNMYNGQTTISDSAGNLLFYTNAAKIYTSSNNIMMNGDSINFGESWLQWGGIAYNWLQDIIGLPTDSANLWNLFHYFVLINDSSYLGGYPWRIYQTQLNMNLDSGNGEVLFKNKTVIQDTLATYVTACKHANGRDWWLLVHTYYSNCFYTFLVEPDTIVHYPNQCLGRNYVPGDAGQAVFSPDGTKFAWVSSYAGVNLYDFDRCSGELSNALNLPAYPNIDSGSLQYGIAFSPNSRFMYVSQATYILQFDTWAGEVWGSLDTVGYYVSPPDTSFPVPGPYFLMQLGPDGKIYISGGNGIYYLHVINQPDLKGDSCNFIAYGFRLPTENTEGIPNFPNYRLGPLIGSPCDTLYKTDTTLAVNPSPKERDLQVYPNPAANYAIIDYGFTDWGKGPVNLAITNALGQQVYEQSLPMYSGFQRIDVSKFAPGMYTAIIKRSTGIVATARFVKE